MGSALTPAEAEVVKYLRETALSHKQIAHERGCAKKTVDALAYRAYQKLGVHSRMELILERQT
jgi:DNA-binding CsgD family transcriptional regulator